MRETHSNRLLCALMVADGLRAAPMPERAAVLLQALAKEYRRAVRQRDDARETLRKRKAARKGAKTR